MTIKFKAQLDDHKTRTVAIEFDDGTTEEINILSSATRQFRNALTIYQAKVKKIEDEKIPLTEKVKLKSRIGEDYEVERENKHAKDLHAEFSSSIVVGWDNEEGYNKLFDEMDLCKEIQSVSMLMGKEFSDLKKT